MTPNGPASTEDGIRQAVEIDIPVGHDGPERWRFDPGTSRDHVSQGFIETQSRALNIATYVGDAGKLQQSLHRPVLADLPCRTGNATSTWIVSYRSCSRTSNPVHSSVWGQHCGTAIATFPIPVRAVTQFPGTVLRDPDVGRLVLFEVKVFCNFLCRLHRDGMLFGAASEDDGERQPAQNARLSKRRQLTRVFSTMSLRACSV